MSLLSPMARQQSGALEAHGRGATLVRSPGERKEKEREREGKKQRERLSRLNLFLVAFPLAISYRIKASQSSKLLYRRQGKPHPLYHDITVLCTSVGCFESF